MTVPNIMTYKMFIKIINEHVERKRINPYYATNYKKPLKTKQIIKRLVKPCR